MLEESESPDSELLLFEELSWLCESLESCLTGAQAEALNAISTANVKGVNIFFFIVNLLR
ncbi:hypothetical protein SDC9_153557 [bioreactor metagenome]|uniref:Uncharacterized protein n=1 Tax=bioreactor metagenome TaxID=1076179 RepID=A0A645EW88_9ZZZZ